VVCLCVCATWTNIVLMMFDIDDSADNDDDEEDDDETTNSLFASVSMTTCIIQCLVTHDN